MLKRERITVWRDLAYPLVAIRHLTPLRNEERVLTVSPQFRHTLSRELERGKNGLFRIDSTCQKCGVCETHCIGDGSLEKWEFEHNCGNLRMIHPKEPTR